MTDSTPGGFPDTPGPDATLEQDADVRALLAFLRDEPVEMPPEVELRLYAVLAEERRSAAAVVGATPTASSADEESTAGGGWTAPVTVLPVRAERRGPSMRAFTVVGGLAAAAVVVVGAVNLLGGMNLSGGSSSSAGAASSSAGSVAGAGPEAAGGQAVVTASGTAYAKSTLATQVLALTAAARTPARVATADAATPAPAASASGTDSTLGTAASASTAYRLAIQALQTPGSAAACVNRLTAGETSDALAIDAGTFAGKPALVVVVPTSGDPSTLDVFIVPLDCSPSFVDFERVPAS